MDGPKLSEAVDTCSLSISCQYHTYALRLHPSMVPSGLLLAAGGSFHRFTAIDGAQCKRRQLCKC